MAHFKLTDADEKFLGVPQGGTLVFAGASGTETFIERDRDTVVRLTVQSAAIATAEGGALEVCIQIGDASAKGQDGPSAVETQLRASQSVQVLAKAGERIAFKAYPNPTRAHVLRTVVWTSDLKHEYPSEPAQRPANNAQHAANAQEVTAART